MIEETTICPYTGLRSFSEDEALYFKGREAQIDQMTVLLEKNKFLMVTGASGEGKSSLIFAGLIPNARAGFFKARYNNWVVADFRPERTPVKNMARAVSGITGSQAFTTEIELRRGFSSLVDLYKNSPLYIDEHDEKWRQLGEPDKKTRKREAANLLVLVDQFEEFFTNPENFHKGAPTPDSQIVVNVLLETAKIALNENLPIYVVCTMRSDYIGQCSAFRGLPEYIGFSQFFVPRLKRKEIKQVIEEPALLSGNRITQRLVERLVYDLAEGIDQLPILQHALAQIWLVADHGREEMDLVHYAMVGGMSPTELPDGDQKRFATWFGNLPEYHKKYYQEPGLNRVIELHANRIYDGAWEYYNERHPDIPISQKDAKNIMALTFACLTKIDNSRAVRNRMTLREITQIIHRSELSADVVGGVLNVCREESNSFIRPFKTDDPDSQDLLSDSVLDITHESLIRNWGRLNKWATQEYEFYTTFLDFKKQLDRWTDNKKSSDYLLPIGPLSFFENWYAQCKPNTFWINRYIGMGDQSLHESERLLRDIQEFLRRSARKVIVTRTFMKYGANRIAVVASILLMFLFSAFFGYDAEQKKNARVIAKVRSAGQALLKSKEVAIRDKADFLLVQERFSPGYIMGYVRRLEDARFRINLSLEIYAEFVKISRHSTKPIKAELVSLIHQDLDAYPRKAGDMTFVVQKYNYLLTLVGYDNYYNPTSEAQVVLSSTASSLYDLLLAAYIGKNSDEAGISNTLNLAVHYWLTFGHPDQKKIQALANTISPLGSPEAKARFESYYPKGNYLSVYELQLDYGAGYHTLASLYAASGDIASMLACFEILGTDRNYFNGVYTFNNCANPLGYLYQYGYREEMEKVAQWIVSRTGSKTVDVYTGVLDQTGFLKFFFELNIDPGVNRSYKGSYFPNLTFLDEKSVIELERDVETAILAVNDLPERNFKLAQHYKRVAVYASKLRYDRGMPPDQPLIQALLDKSWAHFEAVPESYLKTTVAVPYRYFTDGKRKLDLTRRQHYLYPDPLGAWSDQSYLSHVFFDFVKQKDPAHLYNSSEDLKLLHRWVANYFERPPIESGRLFKNDMALSDSTLTDVLAIVNASPYKSSFDANLIVMALANRAFSRGDKELGTKYFQLVKQDNLYASANTYEYLNKTFVYNELKDLSINLAKVGQTTEAMAMSERFEKPYQVVFSYVLNARHLYNQNYDPQAFLMLDSAMTKMDRINLGDLADFEDFRFHMIYVYGEMGGDEIQSDAIRIMKEMKQGNKWLGSLTYTWALASSGNYYQATVAIPSWFTESQDLIARALILDAACIERERKDGIQGWDELSDYMTFDFDYILYEPF